MDLDVGLLAQRLDGAERINSVQSKQIEELQAQASETRGAQAQAAQAANNFGKYIGPIASGILFIVSLGVGGGIYGQLNKINAEIVDLALAAEKREARVASIEVTITSLSNRISSLSADGASTKTDLTSLESKQSSGFIEVETQLRSVVDLLNTREASARQFMGIIWQKVTGNDLPPNDYLAEKIPAQATTIIGGSK